MPKLTKDQIFIRTAGTVNGDATAPTPTDTEYGVWTELLEEANQEWPAAYNFRVLEKTYQVTAMTSGTSVGLPEDFNKFLGYPEFDGNQYAEVRSEDLALYVKQNYVNVKMNASHIAYLYTSPLKGTGGSYVAASIRYIHTPTAMSTGSSTSPCPDDNFLVARLKEKVMKQRGDPAFSLFQDEADAILQRMIENEVVQFVQLDRSTKSTFDRPGGFTIGQD